MRQRQWAVATLTFFLVFPAGGLWICWLIAHNNIVNSAKPFAGVAANDILSNSSAQKLDEYGTLVLRQSDAEKKYSALRPNYGGLKSVTELKYGKAWADDRGGTVFQFVQFSGHATFEKGTAGFKFTAARRTMSPEWRIDSFELDPR
jgi:hypothetical protein